MRCSDGPPWLIGRCVPSGVDRTCTFRRRFTDGRNTGAGDRSSARLRKNVARRRRQRFLIEREATLAVAERRSSMGWVRVVIAVALAVAVLVPMATVAAWASSDNSDARTRIESERRG